MNRPDYSPRGTASPASVPARDKARAPRAFKGGGVPEVALLGGGSWLRANFGPALGSLHRRGELRVISWTELPPDEAEWLAREFPRARAVTNPELMDAGPDTLALVASPLRHRPARIAAALRRGWNVLSACPPAVGAGELARLCALAEQHEVTLAVDLPHRLESGNRWLRVIADGRALGTCMAFRVRDGSRATGPEEVPPPGVWIDPGIRAFDLIAGWLGPLQAVSAADDSLGGAEAVARAEFTFDRNRRGTLCLDQDWIKPTEHELVCRRGTARWEPGEPGSAKLGFRDTEMELSGTLGPPNSDEKSSDALRRERQLRQLLGALLRRGTAPNDASTLLPALELADQCRRIRTMLPLPWLSPNESAVASSLGTHRHAA